MNNRPTLTGLDLFTYAPPDVKILTHEECIGFDIKYDPVQRERLIKFLTYDEMHLGSYVIICGKEREFWDEFKLVQDEILEAMHQQQAAQY